MVWLACNCLKVRASLSAINVSFSLTTLSRSDSSWCVWACVCVCVCVRVCVRVCVCVCVAWVCDVRVHAHVFSAGYTVYIYMYGYSHRLSLDLQMVFMHAYQILFLSPFLIKKAWAIIDDNKIQQTKHALS